MTPGELYWVEFGPPIGHEQAGRRPAIVLQDDTYAGPVGTVIAVPVTGQPANTRFAATVVVVPTQANGLLKQSVVLVYQARAIDRRRFRNRIGVAEPAVMVNILTELDRLPGRTTSPSQPAMNPVPLSPPAAP